MLLLVLVLVLIAFGLLVVALLSGSVLWAWISVAVSVAAAVALLVDWLQRRAAVKAGAEPEQPAVPVAAPPAPMGPAPRGYRPMPDIEPVTEVIPVVGQVSHASPGGATPGDASAPAAPGTRPDTETTSVMPLVGPPGSAGRPPGAGDADTRSSGSLSPSVTSDEVHSGLGATPDGPAEPVPTDGDEGPGRAGGTAAAGPAGAPSDHSAAGPQDSPTVVTAIPAGLAAAAAGAAGRPAEPAEEPAAEQATETPEEPAAATAPPASTPPASVGEPPEEQRDPEIAAVVAQLDDEVVVVDEQPRYHVAGCRALPGRPLIPLPAREAVELGFTPCGWCSPDRTMAGRHQPAAH